MLQIRTVIAVPVKDEAARIGSCLAAMATQSVIRADAIVLLINNTTDGTADIVHTLAPSLPVPVHAIEHVFPPEAASAGAARHMAMEYAADLLGNDGVLLTTDADGRVPHDWVAANLAHIAGGVDAVAGRVVLDPDEAARLPAVLHADDALEVAYARALDEIVARIDPDPWDPWPRHIEHSGASLAVTLGAYRRAGGMPAAPLAEDRRFVAALRRIDARIRHAPEIVVVVSGRTVGRAEGGMADTIRRRLTARDPYLDDALEPVGLAVRRAKLRAALRRARESVDEKYVEWETIARLSGAPASAIKASFATKYIGQGVELLESHGPLANRELVLATEVRQQTAAAQLILERLREVPFARSTSSLTEVDVV